ncbi:MAG: hypothetical protein CM15mP77_3060 [Synechococcus sp.]|nr:MAG: hypothetical protein CM15mP77_3060 [Synechococcus sp.]
MRWSESGGGALWTPTHRSGPIATRPSDRPARRGQCTNQKDNPESPCRDSCLSGQPAGGPFRTERGRCGSSVTGTDPPLRQCLQVPQQIRFCWRSRKWGWPLQMNKVDHLGRHQLVRSTGASEQMLLRRPWTPSTDGRAVAWHPNAGRQVSNRCCQCSVRPARTASAATLPEDCHQRHDAGLQ